MNRIKHLKSVFYNFSTLWIFIIITLIFMIFGNDFLKAGNISNILNQAAFLGLIGASQMIVILLGDINLSIGSVMALSTVLCGQMMLEKNHINFLVPVLLVMFFGAASGAVNGALTTKLRIPAFLATFATMYIARGAAWLYIGQGVFYGINDSIRFMATGVIFQVGDFRVTMPMIIFLVFALIMGFLLNGTNIGRKIYFLGSNPTAAHFSGISIKKVALIAHIVSGLIAGLAGIMYVGRINASDATLGTSYEFTAIAVALVGGVLMSGGEGNIWGVMGGALIVSVIQTGMNNLQVPTSLQTAFLGLIIVLSVFLNGIFQKKRVQLSDSIGGKVPASKKTEKAAE